MDWYCLEVADGRQRARSIVPADAPRRVSSTTEGRVVGFSQLSYRASEWDTVYALGGRPRKDDEKKVSLSIRRRPIAGGGDVLISTSAGRFHWWGVFRARKSSLLLVRDESEPMVAGHPPRFEPHLSILGRSAVGGAFLRAID